MQATFATLRRGLDLLRIGLAAHKVRKQRGPERTAAQRALAAMLADARGLTMKIGQTFAGADPDSPFRELVAGADPLPLEVMRPVFERSTGRSIDAVFASFEESAAAGSLGQVHLATLRDGRKVAVKIRYPGVASSVKAELGLSGLAPAAGPVKRWGFDLAGYKRVLRDNMRRELDYRSEADRQRRMKEALVVPGLRVPEVIGELSNECVLTQERVDGVLLDGAARWPLEDRLLIGRILLATFFTSLFVVGEVHGDPNVGNTLFSRTEEGAPLVALVDFGCTVPVSLERRLSLLGLLLELRDGSTGSELSRLAGAGFDAEKLSRIVRLPDLCRVLFRPLLVDGPFDVRTWRVGEELTDLLGDARWWFRSAGPPDLLLLVRAFNGLATQLGVLDVRLPWWPVFTAAVGREPIARARAFEPPPLPEGVTYRVAEGPRSAHRLKVEIMEGDRPAMDLSFPAEAVRSLGELIPADVHARLEPAEAQRLRELSRELVEGDIEPMTLFEYSSHGRRYRVWLE